MGCDEDTSVKEIEDNYKIEVIPQDQRLNKNIKIDMSENKNKYIMNCSEYLNQKIPEKNGNNTNNLNTVIRNSNNMESNIDNFNTNKINTNKSNVDNNYQKFEDKSFPNQKLSTEVMEILEVDNSDIEWKSAKEIFGKNVRIFGETISLKDIKSGLVNNSCFVSVISSLSEYPSIIFQLFRTVSFPTEDEPIEVCLRIEGKWTVVYVDDMFMVNKTSGVPIFSTSPTKNIWGMILEKAWAKVCGGYDHIIGGNASEIFEAFTSFRVIEIDLKKFEIDNFWKYINDALSYNLIMTCDTKDELTDLEQFGFFNDYSFSLLGIEEIEKKINEKKVKIKIVQIRNPGGEKGGVKTEVDTELLEDNGIEKYEENGILIINLNTFMKIFSSITICIPTAALLTRLINIPIDKATDFGIVRILIEQESNICISLFSLSHRFHEEINPEKDIFKNLILIQIFRNKQKGVYINSSFNATLSAIVKPGEYICIYNVDYMKRNVKEIHPYKLIITNTKPFKFFLDEPDNDHKLTKYIMINKIETIEKYEKRFKDDFVVFTGNKFEFTSFGFFYMKNKIKKIKYVKPSVYLKNYRSIEGEFPLSLKMKKNSIFFFLFNRNKIKSTYQTGANVGFYKDEVPNAIEPIEYEKLPEKYCREVEYTEQKYDYEFKYQN